MWPIVGRKLVGEVFSGRDALWEGLVEAFGTITPDQVLRLYASMPSRLAALKADKGGHTRY